MFFEHYSSEIPDFLKQPEAGKMDLKFPIVR